MIDWAKLDELREDVGAADFDEVVALFLGDTDAAIATLDATPDLEARLHYLKGSAMTVGLGDFARLCQQGEDAAARGGAVDLAALRACYARSRAALLEGLPPLPAGLAVR
jgi:HPt (histidine-containing phosphotransfer) domain-containing protein